MKPSDHHRQSIRAPGFDYRDGATYFVTVCTANREHLFGDIRNGVMGLSDIGCVVADELQKTPIIRPYVHIDTWIIMPNHVHLLLAVRASPRDAPTSPPRGMTIRLDATTRQFSAQSLGSIINHFKSACTKRINALYDFNGTIWQRNYHEHIVRSQEESDRIRTYIRQNPANWPGDEYRHPTP